MDSRGPHVRGSLGENLQGLFARLVQDWQIWWPFWDLRDLEATSLRCCVCVDCMSVSAHFTKINIPGIVRYFLHTFSKNDAVWRHMQYEMLYFVYVMMTLMRLYIYIISIPHPRTSKKNVSHIFAFIFIPKYSIGNWTLLEVLPCLSCFRTTL